MAGKRPRGFFDWGWGLSMIFRSLLVLSLAASTALAQSSNKPPGSSEATTPGRSGTNTAEAPPKEEEHPPLRIGFLVGVGAPRSATAEVYFKFFDVLGIGASYTYLPKFVGDWILKAYNVYDPSLSVTSHSWELALRIYPTRGAFFLGANLGMGSVEAVLHGSTRNATAKVDGPFVAPRIGWLWIFASGITLGLDGGAQIPLGDPEIIFDPPAFRDFRPLYNAARTVGKSVLPVLNFRLGYTL
jgi:hypothetical protein